jgi:hypothetical protein
MPDKFSGKKYDLMITPIDEEGSRTKNDPDTANPPVEIDPPDPMDLAHGLDRGNSSRGGKNPSRG